MRSTTASKLAQAIQLFHLDGYSSYTHCQLAKVSGVARKTLSRNQDLIIMLDYALKAEMGEFN